MSDPNAQWADAFLNYLGDPVTSTNQAEVEAWMRAESGGVGSYNNPLNTTLQEPGSWGVNYNNGYPVQGYPNEQEGIQADAAALQGNFPGYSNIRNDLAAGNVPYGQFAADVGNSPWGTSGSLIGQVLGSGVSQYGGAQSDTGNISPGGYGAYTGGSQTDPLAGIFGQMLAGQSAATQPEIASLNTQLALAQGNTPQEQAYLQQLYGYQQQGFGVQGQQLNLQGNVLGQQLANLGTNYGLQQQQFGLQGQQLDLSKQQTQYNQGQQLQGNTQNSAGAGTLNSIGYGQRAGNINQEANFALQGNALQQQQLGVTEQQAAAQYGQSQQQIQDAQQQLGLTAQSLGISEQEAEARFQNALNQTGLSGAMTVQQLLGQIAAVQAGQYTPINNLLGSLASAGAPIAPLLGSSGAATGTTNTAGNNLGTGGQ